MGSRGSPQLGFLAVLQRKTQARNPIEGCVSSWLLNSKFSGPSPQPNPCIAQKSAKRLGSPPGARLYASACPAAELPECQGLSMMCSVLGSTGYRVYCTVMEPISKLWSCQSFLDGVDKTKLAADPAANAEAARLLRELEDYLRRFCIYDRSGI